MPNRFSEAFSPPLVLVVDDQNTNVQLLGQTLDNAGYEVMPALSGEQAVARAQRRTPDLVLLDLVMPGMDGAQTCRALHTLPGCAEVPVIFVTGANDRGSLVTAFSAGAVDYITKPFVVEELLARVKTHLDLKLSRDRLAVMLREREDVTSIVAHDLKNPLNCIRFAARMMKDGAADQDELLDDIYQSSEEALRFIQRFLARGAEGQRLRQFSAERFELSEAAREAAQLQRAHAQARSVEVLVQGGGAVYADSFMARNVIRGLLSNALNHAPQGSTIEIEIGPSRPGYTHCLVMDRGPGVPAGEVNKLFQRFARVAVAREPAPNNEYSSGLGLAIAKHDVAQMGGHLWYEPRVGGGAVFAFELPRGPLLAAAGAEPAEAAGAQAQKKRGGG